MNNVTWLRGVGKKRAGESEVCPSAIEHELALTALAN
jgi:hypothetical protein